MVFKFTLSKVYSELYYWATKSTYQTLGSWKSSYIYIWLLTRGKEMSVCSNFQGEPVDLKADIAVLHTPWSKAGKKGLYCTCSCCSSWGWRDCCSTRRRGWWMIKSNSLQNTKEVTFIQKRVRIKSKSVQKTMMTTCMQKKVKIKSNSMKSAREVTWMRKRVKKKYDSNQES